MISRIAEDDLSEWRMARLFNSFFDYSRGNVGVALQSWVSHIEKVAQERLMMREPESPEAEVLEQLENDWIVILLQIMLHKRLTAKRLARILNEDEKSLHLSLNTLKRTGLIVENNEGILKIDPYILPHLRQKFHQLEVL